MLIEIEEDELCELIVKELRGWTDDDDIIELYLKMYESHGYEEFRYGQIQEVVDNDYINNTSRIYPGDEAYDDIKTLYDEDGLGSIYMRPSLNHGYDSIEAEYNHIFLVRD